MHTTFTPPVILHICKRHALSIYTQEINTDLQWNTKSKLMSIIIELTKFLNISSCKVRWYRFSRRTIYIPYRTIVERFSVVRIHHFVFVWSGGLHIVTMYYSDRFFSAL